VYAGTAGGNGGRSHELWAWVCLQVGVPFSDGARCIRFRLGFASSCVRSTVKSNGCRPESGPEAQQPTRTGRPGAARGSTHWNTWKELVSKSRPGVTVFSKRSPSPDHRREPAGVPREARNGRVTRQSPTQTQLENVTRYRSPMYSVPFLGSPRRHPGKRSLALLDEQSHRPHVKMRSRKNYIGYMNWGRPCDCEEMVVPACSTPRMLLGVYT